MKKGGRLGGQGACCKGAGRLRGRAAERQRGGGVHAIQCQFGSKKYFGIFGNFGSI